MKTKKELKETLKKEKLNQKKEQCIKSFREYLEKKGREGHMPGFYYVNSYIIYFSEYSLLGREYNSMTIYTSVEKLAEIYPFNVSLKEVKNFINFCKKLFNF